MAPRKVRLVSGALKGMSALVAKDQLAFIVKRSSKPFSKLLDSALANAQNNFGLVKDNLFIKEIRVNEGPKLKRFRPHGFGMTLPIEKKTSHITIILEEKVPGLKVESKPRAIPESVSPTEETAKSIKPTKGREKQSVKQEKSGGGIRGLTRRLFRRKAM